MFFNENNRAWQRLSMGGVAGLRKKPGEKIHGKNLRAKVGLLWYVIRFFTHTAERLSATFF